MKRYNKIYVTDWSDYDFEEFIKDNSSLFYAFAYRYIKNGQDIKDILQDCYIKMWNNKKKISSMESPHNYIFSMIKNSALNYIRDNKKMSIGFDEIKDISQVADKIDYDNNIFEAECSRIVADAIMELSPQSRNVLNKIMSGMTMEQVATELDISVNSVKTIKYRALDKLSKLLPNRMLGIIYYLWI